MNESILHALMQLFALVVNVDESGLSPEARAILQEYLKLQLSEDLVEEYLGIFDRYLKLYRTKSKDIKKVKKRIASKSVKVLTIGEDINEQLQQKEKVVVILRLLEFISKSEYGFEEIDFVNTIADVFNINQDEYKDLKTFVLGGEIKNEKNLLIIKKEKTDEGNYRFIKEENLEGEIRMLYLKSSNTIILKYIGKETLYLNGFIIISGHHYIFDEGSVLKNPKIKPIYYSDIITQFIHSERKEKIEFCAKNISFTFPNSENGIKEFSIIEESGKLIGILGASGAGKSTLLNLLIGTLPLDSGKILINGYDIHNEKDKLEGIIGYIPQDDLLIEELTVFQNLYFNALLCFKGSSHYEILSRVVRILKELDLYEIKDLKVGNPLNKYISGGQRKRLNIALELIREPAILFVDEPTSGLSSSDSEVVMSLLKELSLKGKLVFVNIHQPSSDIFRLFDKIIILDKGGYPTYYGNPIAGVAYFRKMSNIANAEAVICPVCGNINPDQILELMEAKVVNEYGKLTNKRKYPPEFWYKKYKEQIEVNQPKECSKEKSPLPKTYFQIEKPFNQFKIFSLRNFLRKITNKQYILLNIFEPPLLAVILAYFSKYIAGTLENPDIYLFSKNVNIPAFLFMSVVVALFLGLTVSAEEIIKDRKILKREEFLNLSYTAYINSKIVFLVILSAFQMFLYVLISHQILEIKGMFFRHWFILFTTAVWANILGLNISAALNSVITIYISIPLILIPQLLFSGTVIEFSKLHKDFASQKYVPVIGELMTSKWAYEALMVTQYKDNLYEKNFFEIDKKIKNANFMYQSYYDYLSNMINYIYSNQEKQEKKDIVKNKMRILIGEINKIENLTGKNFKRKDSLKIGKKISKGVKSDLIYYLYNTINIPYRQKEIIYKRQKDSILKSLVQKLGSYEAVIKLKQDNHNERVEDYVCNKFEVRKIIEGDNELIRLDCPIYREPDSRIGRSHFYAATKKIGNFKIDTFYFNNLFIWLFSLFLYILLISRVLEKSTKKELKNIKENF